MSRDIMKRFWMVYGLWSAAPSKMHESYDDAYAECIRLCEKEPGVTFVVLESVKAMAVAKPIVQVRTLARKVADIPRNCRRNG